MGIILDSGRLEAIHDDLTAPFHLAIDLFGKEGVDEFKEVGEALTGGELTGDVGVIVHEVVGINQDTVFLFVGKQEVIVVCFGPLCVEEPVVVVALPGDVEGVAVKEDVRPGE